MYNNRSKQISVFRVIQIFLYICTYYYRIYILVPTNVGKCNLFFNNKDKIRFLLSNFCSVVAISVKCWYYRYYIIIKKTDKLSVIILKFITTYIVVA